MNKTLLLLLVCVHLQSLAQTDQNGNPVFNSKQFANDTLGNYQISSNYYTLKNNIENQKSSVYITDKPSKKQIAAAAVNLPTNFFVVTQQKSIVNIILFTDQPSRSFLLVNPNTGEQRRIPSTLIGDIPESRAIEIVSENYDPKARIENGILYFNKMEFKIITNHDIKRDVFKLVSQQPLPQHDSSKITMLSKEELKNKVIEESTVGGAFDFFTEIKGHEMDGIQVVPGKFTTRLGLALYKWGEANFKLGVNSAEDALEFWKALKKRLPNEREKDYITLGFNRGLEKNP